MDASPFAGILTDLLARIPGAYAVALVDREGETVDYAGLGDPFDMKVTAATLRIVLQELERFGVLGEPRWLVIRGAKKSLFARTMPDGYAVVLLLRRRAGFTASRRAFAACARALAVEAGWRYVEEKPRWFPVQVDTDRLGRPRRVAGVPVAILGAVVGLPPKERGFRVRTASGLEITVVREARRAWYADDQIAAAEPSQEP